MSSHFVVLEFQLPLPPTANITSFNSLRRQLYRLSYAQKTTDIPFYRLLSLCVAPKLLRLPSLGLHTTAKYRSATIIAIKIGGSQALTELVLSLQSNHMLLDHLTDAAHFTHIMSSRSFFNPSPTVVLPSAAPDQYFGNHYMDQDTNAPMLNNISSTTNGLHGQPLAATPTPPEIKPSLAGRKRSRGDIFSEVEEDGGRNDDGSIPTPPTEEPANMQSNGCLDDRMEQDQDQLASAVKRPSVTSRKSQRMDSKASLSGSDDLAQLILPPSIREATTEPLIDEATRSLGISWIRMDSSEALQISQRAYSKWIQNHYPRLSDVAIWLENSALPAYLVTANNTGNGQREYYLFSNDLTEARLVTTDPSQLIPRLRMLPALELAAPGGKLLAESDPITASQNEVDDAQVEAHIVIGGCAAHAMEMD